MWFWKGRELVMHMSTTFSEVLRYSEMFLFLIWMSRIAITVVCLHIRWELLHTNRPFLLIATHGIVPVPGPPCKIANNSHNAYPAKLWPCLHKYYRMMWITKHKTSLGITLRCRPPTYTTNTSQRVKHRNISFQREIYPLQLTGHSTWNRDGKLQFHGWPGGTKRASTS